jgi:hypothetical protein
MFQKEILGGYLEEGSRYLGLKFKLLRLYTFGDIPCEISGSEIILNLFILEFSLYNFLCDV